MAANTNIEVVKIEPRLLKNVTAILVNAKHTYRADKRTDGASDTQVDG